MCACRRPQAGRDHQVGAGPSIVLLRHITQEPATIPKPLSGSIQPFPVPQSVHCRTSGLTTRQSTKVDPVGAFGGNPFRQGSPVTFLLRDGGIA
jgi:hypothetical protein